MIESVDQISHVLTHIDFRIPVTGEQLRIAIDQVGRENLIEQAFFICLIKMFQTVREQAEGTEAKNPLGASFFELLGHVEEGFAG